MPLDQLERLADKVTRFRDVCRAYGRVLHTGFAKRPYGNATVVQARVTSFASRRNVGFPRTFLDRGERKDAKRDAHRRRV
jgi:hypothetical protein